jgi:cytochrome c oxidase cbb3-type subunit 3
MKRLLTFLFMILFPMASWAQVPAPAPASIWDDPMLLFYVVVGFMFVVALLVLVVALYLLQVVNILASKAAQEKAEKLGVIFKPEPSVFRKLWDNINALRPLEKESELVLDHNYDGITELDNHLPPWWRWLFYVTIVFAGVYLLVYHVFSTLPLSGGEYDNEVAYANEQLVKMKAANPGPAIDETSVEATTDAKLLADGKSTFLNTCSTCHRRDGGGDIGPNLTDEYWKHGGSIKNIFKVVKEGVAGTNMVAWGGVMSPEAIRNVASYVLTLQGSKPVNPKKPEGNLYKPEVVPVKADTTKAQSSL